MYKAVVNFVDLQDHNYRYLTGDAYPRKGYTPSDERIASLAGTNNKRGVPVIAEVPKKAAVKPGEEPVEERVEIPVESVEEPQKRRRGRKKNA